LDGAHIEEGCPFETAVAFVFRVDGIGHFHIGLSWAAEEVYGAALEAGLCGGDWGFGFEFFYVHRGTSSQTIRHPSGTRRRRRTW
jgi:hypothetical protein